MPLKPTFNYSPNFSLPKRSKKQIKFIIYHYTGMKKESSAINRLTDIKSGVSCHYLIKKNGEIVMLVPELYTAWHAGKSCWKNFNSLNKDSIGIEISNPGHAFHYKKFSNDQIISLLKLSKYLIKKYKIDYRNILGHSDIAPDRKKDPGEKFPWEHFSKNKVGLWHNIKIDTLNSARNCKINIKSKKIFLKNLKKIGYSKNNEKYSNRDKYQTYVVKAFQRRYRPNLINGKIDKECLIISNILIKKN
jgi:N-acetylmuramoyl-L-alanine amidase